VLVPSTCLDAPAELLKPRETWSNEAASDGRARKLAGTFLENSRIYGGHSVPEVRTAGPRVP
jgi:phosphoenolpyruvate carboxykinase (ATP)